MLQQMLLMTTLDTGVASLIQHQPKGALLDQSSQATDRERARAQVQQSLSGRGFAPDRLKASQ